MATGRANTEDDGTLDVAINSNRQLSYQFSGGKKEHATGTFRLRGANQLLFTPTGGEEKDEETWVYTFDDFGRLKLEMEEDKARRPGNVHAQPSRIATSCGPTSRPLIANFAGELRRNLRQFYRRAAPCPAAKRAARLDTSRGCSSVGRATDF